MAYTNVAKVQTSFNNFYLLLTNIFKLLQKAYCIYRIRLKNEGTIVESSFKVYWKNIGDNSFSIYYTIGYTYQDIM